MCNIEKQLENNEKSTEHKNVDEMNKENVIKTKQQLKEEQENLKEELKLRKMFPIFQLPKELHKISATVGPKLNKLVNYKQNFGPTKNVKEFMEKLSNTEKLINRSKLRLKKEVSRNKSSEKNFDNWSAQILDIREAEVADFQKYGENVLKYLSFVTAAEIKKHNKEKAKQFQKNSSDEAKHKDMKILAVKKTITKQNLRKPQKVRSRSSSE